MAIPSKNNPPSSAVIFLSYRRADSGAMAGRIADQLASQFGNRAVFHDVDSIMAGQDFIAAIKHAIERSEVVLVAIGRQWLDATLVDGTRRIDDPDDAVRLEIEAALRGRKTVLPLLIDGASMPRPETLPESIRPITSINALHIRAGLDFKPDMARLIKAIRANTTRLLVRSAAPREDQRSQSSTRPLVAGAVAMVAAMGLLWVILFHASTLARWDRNVWYVLLLLLGFSIAVVISATSKSYARYTGKVRNGNLELGGPLVVMLLVIGLGFYLVPPPLQQFDFTVFLHGLDGPQAVLLRDSGKLSLDLGADRRTESVGAKGEVRFVGIPADMHDRKVPMALHADRYELADPDLLAPLAKKTYYAAIKPKQLGLSGRVMDSDGRPIERAHIRVAGSSTSTDQEGRFGLFLPADLPVGDRTATITAPGYEEWTALVVPGGNALSVRLLSMTPKE